MNNELEAGWHDLEPDCGEPGAGVEGGTKRTKSPNQATMLVGLVVQGTGVELWHTPDSVPYATLPVGEHLEHWPIRGSYFREWCERQYFVNTGGAIGEQARNEALGVLSGKARFDGPEHPICLRSAQHNEAIYIDLCDREWQTVEVTKAEWRLTDNPPVRFHRAKAMQSLPIPESGDSIAELRRWINVTDDDWPLLCAWLVTALRPSGPYPVLCLHGEQGSGKSTQARMLRALVDPNRAPIRAEPKEPRDLMIAANNGWVVALDNLSFLPGWLSDALCRLSTGGGFSTRTLYANDEETIFDAQRPVILTGINDLATRGDLLDRALVVSLPSIRKDKRKPEAELWSEFEEARGRLLGSLLDGVVAALGNLPTTKLASLPRMADFALWSTAAEPGLGLASGAVMASYDRNQEITNETALEASPIVSSLVDLAKDDWKGSATDLLAAMDNMVDERTRKQRGWPKSPATLGGMLTRMAPNLRNVGIYVDRDREGHDRKRIITIRKAGNTPSAPSALPEVAAFSPMDADGNLDKFNKSPILCPLRSGSNNENIEVEDDADNADSNLQDEVVEWSA